MKYALVDVGSNTIRLNVYEIDEDSKTFERIFSEKETTGLATYVENGKLSNEGIQAACDVLNRFKHIIELFEIKSYDVFATASLRNVDNTQECLKKVKQKTGIKIDLLSGEDEARYGTLGVLGWKYFEQGTIFDIGGGSTEITRIKDGTISSTASLEIGSLNLFKKHVKDIWPTQSEQVKIYSKVQQEFSSIECPKTKHLYAIGGTARAVLKLANNYLGKPKTNRRLTFEEFNEVYAFVMQKDKIVRNTILKACPDRIHTIIPGIIIMYTLCLKVQCADVVISPNGVREGYLIQKMTK